MHLTFSTGPTRAKEIGCQALQIFCGNPRGWQKSPLEESFVRAYRADVARFGIAPLIVHATYLINLAAPDERIFKLSCDGFVNELERASQLGAQFYVVHIGNHMGTGPVEGRRRVALCVKEAEKRVPHCPEILFENTSGSGTTLGTTFEEVAAVMDETGSNRVGLCLDTCHALAAGYDIRNEAGVSAALEKLDKSVGLRRLRCIHLNDSKGELGSRLDRHEHIGKGCIGTAGFKALLAQKVLWDLPVILETPQDGPTDDIDNLWTAIELAAAAGAVSRSDVGSRPKNAPPAKPKNPRPSAKKPVKIAGAVRKPKPAAPPKHRKIRSKP